jgi:endo-1,4-beta-xylanase
MLQEPGMKKAVVAIASLIVAGIVFADKEETSLREEFDDFFLLGSALNYEQIMGQDQASLAFIAQHFSALTAENAMKWERIHPTEGSFNWRYADAITEFAGHNGIHVTGHTLVWHRQTPDRVFEDDAGHAASRELLLARMESHIRTVVGRYKGIIHSWDVVNEALNEDGTLRDSRWRSIIGDDYIQKAFEFAHDADPDALLYYNDFNMYKPAKRAGAFELVRRVRQSGLPVHGIGMQAHYSLDSPSNLDDVEDSILAFSSAQLDVLITELDVSVLPAPGEDNVYDKAFDPYTGGLPASVTREFEARYRDLMQIFLIHSDKISRVTFWGVHDAQSWKNNWPMRGRTDYPLLFDRDNQPKPVIAELISLKNRVRDERDLPAVR